MKRRTLLQFSAGLPSALAMARIQAQDLFWTRVFAVMPETFASMPGKPDYRI